MAKDINTKIKISVDDREVKSFFDNYKRNIKEISFNELFKSKKDKTTLEYLKSTIALTKIQADGLKKLFNEWQAEQNKFNKELLVSEANYKRIFKVKHDYAKQSIEDLKAESAKLAENLAMSKKLGVPARLRHVFAKEKGEIDTEIKTREDLKLKEEQQIAQNKRFAEFEKFKFSEGVKQSQLESDLVEASNTAFLNAFKTGFAGISLLSPFQSFSKMIGGELAAESSVYGRRISELKSGISSNKFAQGLLKTELASGINASTGKELTDMEKRNKEEEIDLFAKKNAVLEKELAPLNRMQAAITGVQGAMAIVGRASQAAANSFKVILGSSISIKDVFTDILSNMNKMLDMYNGMATYSTSTSLITNAAARETQMKYGLSSAETYAFMQAQSLLGMHSVEDLMYMNPSQQQAFTNYLNMYSGWYSQLSSSGVLATIQQFQLDFAVFKQEIAVDLLNWIAQNKDTILSVLKFTLDAVKFIIQLIGKILSFFGVQYDTSSYTSDTSNISNYAGNTNRTVNVKMDNTATGVLSSQDQMENFFNEQMEKLIREVGYSME